MGRLDKDSGSLSLHQIEMSTIQPPPPAPASPPPQPVAAQVVVTVPEPPPTLVRLPPASQIPAELATAPVNNRVEVETPLGRFTIQTSLPVKQNQTLLLRTPDNPAAGKAPFILDVIEIAGKPVSANAAHRGAQTTPPLSKTVNANTNAPPPGNTATPPPADKAGSLSPGSAGVPSPGNARAPSSSTSPPPQPVAAQVVVTVPEPPPTLVRLPPASRIPAELATAPVNNRVEVETPLGRFTIQTSLPVKQNQTLLLRTPDNPAVGKAPFVLDVIEIAGKPVSANAAHRGAQTTPLLSNTVNANTNAPPPGNINALTSGNAGALSGNVSPPTTSSTTVSFTVGTTLNATLLSTTPVFTVNANGTFTLAGSASLISPVSPTAFPGQPPNPQAPAPLGASLGASNPVNSSVPTPVGAGIPPVARAITPSVPGTAIPPAAGVITPPVAGTAIPPVASAITPPVAGTATPPAAGAITPPVAGTTIPPVAGAITPPVAGTAIPPVTGAITPSVAGTATPPAAGAITPPVAGTTIPPVAGAITPPVAGTAIPPVTGAITPSVAGTAIPPVAGAVTSPVAGTTPSASSSLATVQHRAGSQFQLRIQTLSPPPASSLPSPSSNAPAGLANQPPASPSATPPSSPLAPFTVGQLIVGVVTGATVSGNAIVQTPVSILSIPSASPLPPGTELTFRVETTPRPPDALQITSPAFQRPGPVFAQSWPSLDEGLAVLQNTNPAIASQVVEHILPKLNAKLTSTVLFFLSSLRGGDIRGWLGDGAYKALEKARPDLMRRLGEDFRALGSVDEDGRNPVRTADWRGTLLPLLTQNGIEHIRLYTRHFNDDEDQSDEDASGATANRFLIDVTLSNIGRLQLDGMIEKKNRSLDLIVRTSAQLPAMVRTQMMELFSKANDIVGMQGGMSFQATPDGFVEPRASKSDEQPGPGIVI